MLEEGTTVENGPISVGGRELSARGRRTREKLLSAAEEVFAALGYHDASIVKITESAGVAQGTFYNYFDSKQQIFDELIVDLNRRIRRAMSEHAEQGSTRAEKERLGFQGYFEFTSQHPALYRVLRQAEIVAPELLRRHYDKISEGYVAGLRESAKSGEILDVDPEVLAWMLMGIGEIVGMRWILWDDRGEVPPDVFDQMMAFVRRGLGAGETR
jgi:AcrR family transcriptional regulator